MCRTCKAENLQVGLLQLFVSSRKTFLEVQINQAAQSNGGSIAPCIVISAISFPVSVRQKCAVGGKFITDILWIHRLIKECNTIWLV